MSLNQGESCPMSNRRENPSRPQVVENLWTTLFGSSLPGLVSLVLRPDARQTCDREVGFLRRVNGPEGVSTPLPVGCRGSLDPPFQSSNPLVRPGLGLSVSSGPRLPCRLYQREMPAFVDRCRHYAGAIGPRKTIICSNSTRAFPLAP